MKTKITINRADLSEGNFSTIRNEALNDINLSDSALRLLQLMLNNSENWILRTTYYQHKLGWSNDKLSNATKNLIANGYLKIITEHKTKGGKRGFNLDRHFEVNELKVPMNSEVVPSPIIRLCSSESDNQSLMNRAGLKEANKINLDKINLDKINLDKINLDKTNYIMEKPIEIKIPVELSKEIITEEEPYLTLKEKSEIRYTLLWNAFTEKHSNKKELPIEKRIEFIEEVISAISFKETILTTANRNELKNDMYAFLDIEIPKTKVNDIFEPLF